MSDVIGIASLFIAALSYGAYVFNIYRGKTKPHAITWLVWSILNTLVFFEQFESGAGAGAWVTGAAGIANFIIFVLALRYGERNITRFDWLCLGLVATMLIFWSQVSDPLLVVVIAISIYLAGLFPTIRKASQKAHEETALTYGLNGFKFLLAFFALQTVTVVTALYPLTLFIVNTLFTLYLLKARQQQVRVKRKRR